MIFVILWFAPIQFLQPTGKKGENRLKTMLFNFLYQSVWKICNKEGKKGGLEKLQIFHIFVFQVIFCVLTYKWNILETTPKISWTIAQFSVNNFNAFYTIISIMTSLPTLFCLLFLQHCCLVKGDCDAVMKCD